MNKKRAFTLIEMMIVILVIAILALVVGLAVRNAGTRAKVVRKKADVDSINDASCVYHNDSGQVPNSVDDLTVDAGAGPPGYQGPYLRGPHPTDPWSGGDYVLTDGTVTGPADVTNYTS